MTLINPQEVLDKFICFDKKKGKYPAVFLKEEYVGLKYVIESLRPGNMPIIIRLNEKDTNGDFVCMEIEKKIKNSPENLNKLLKLTKFDIKISDTEFIHVSSIKQLMDDTRYLWT